MSRKKKDLDKDIMFQKIMPALSDNPFSATYQPETEEPEPIQEAFTEDETLSALKNKLFGRSPGFDENQSVATMNVMESLVLRNVDTVIKRFNVCNCDRCRCDITALALNNLKPKYVVVTPQELKEAEDAVPKQQVMDALIKAVLKVRAHPNH